MLGWRLACPLRASIRSRRARLTRTPDFRRASPSTATRGVVSSTTSASSRARGWMPPAPRVMHAANTARAGAVRRYRVLRAAAARTGRDMRIRTALVTHAARRRTSAIRMDGLDHYRRRRGDVLRRPAQGRVPARVRPVSSSTTRPATSRTRRRTCRQARGGRRNNGWNAVRPISRSSPRPGARTERAPLPVPAARARQLVAAAVEPEVADARSLRVVKLVDQRVVSRASWARPTTPPSIEQPPQLSLACAAPAAVQGAQRRRTLAVGDDGACPIFRREMAPSSRKAAGVAVHAGRASLQVAASDSGAARRRRRSTSWRLNSQSGAAAARGGRDPLAKRAWRSRGTGRCVPAFGRHTAAASNAGSKTLTPASVHSMAIRPRPAAGWPSPVDACSSWREGARDQAGSRAAPAGRCRSSVPTPGYSTAVETAPRGCARRGCPGQR